MAHIDPTVASTLDSQLSSGNVDEIDEDALLDSLDNDPSLDHLREQRLQQLHTELTRAKDLQSQEHGVHTEIKDEKAILNITTSTKYCVVHFFKPDFARCGVMDSMLETLAPKHFDTRFLRINVENAPFLVTKLKVQVLPCVLVLIDGVSVDRIIGFEGLGNNVDTFTARDLEARLLQAGVLTRPKFLAAGDNSLRRQWQDEPGGNADGAASEDDEEWD